MEHVGHLISFSQPCVIALIREIETVLFFPLAPPTRFTYIVPMYKYTRVVCFTARGPGNEGSIRSRPWMQFFLSSQPNQTPHAHLGTLGRKSCPLVSRRPHFFIDRAPQCSNKQATVQETRFPEPLR